MKLIRLFKECFWDRNPPSPSTVWQSEIPIIAGGIVGLWENAEENQHLIGCLIISLTHSLLIEMRAILIIQEVKYKLVYITRLFLAALTLRLHSTEQCIHKHNTNYTIEKYMHRKITQCKLHASIRPYVHNKYFIWLAPI